MAWFVGSLTDWNDFMKQRNESIESHWKLPKCPGCSAHIEAEYICEAGGICWLCDNISQPFWCNPVNKDLAQRFLSPVVMELLSQCLVEQ